MHVSNESHVLHAHVLTLNMTTLHANLNHPKNCTNDIIIYIQWWFLSYFSTNSTGTLFMLRLIESVTKLAEALNHKTISHSRSTRDFSVYIEWNKWYWRRRYGTGLCMMYGWTNTVAGQYDIHTEVGVHVVYKCWSRAYHFYNQASRSLLIKQYDYNEIKTKTITCSLFTVY